MPVERLVTALKKHGVSKALAISTVGLLHNHGDGNNETLRMCAADEMLIPVATIDPRGYFGPPGIIGKIAEQGFKMFRFFPVLQGWKLDHSAFGDVLAELDAVGLPVMMQASEPGHSSMLAGNLFGRKNVFVLEGVSFENMAEAVSVMRKFDNLWMDTRELRVPGALRFLVDQVGADRVVFGSGCLRSSFASAYAYVVESEIKDEDKEKILSGNMSRLLGG